MIRLCDTTFVVQRFERSFLSFAGLPFRQLPSMPWRTAHLCNWDCLSKACICGAEGTCEGDPRHPYDVHACIAILGSVDLASSAQGRDNLQRAHRDPECSSAPAVDEGQVEHVPNKGES